MGSDQVNAFLTHLAVNEKVAASTQNLERGYGEAYLTFALERKYPNAAKEWIWQFVFPSDQLCKDPRSEVVRRYHLHESGLQKALKQAVMLAGIEKRVRCQVFRR